MNLIFDLKKSNAIPLVGKDLYVSSKRFNKKYNIFFIKTGNEKTWRVENKLLNFVMDEKKELMDCWVFFKKIKAFWMQDCCERFKVKSIFENEECKKMYNNGLEDVVRRIEVIVSKHCLVDKNGKKLKT